MAGYNPLNYFSFGKKKDAPTTPKESADQVLPQDGASEAAPHADTVDPADLPSSLCCVLSRVIRRLRRLPHSPYW